MKLHFKHTEWRDRSSWEAEEWEDRHLTAVLISDAVVEAVEKARRSDELWGAVIPHVIERSMRIVAAESGDAEQGAQILMTKIAEAAEFSASEGEKAIVQLGEWILQGAYQAGSDLGDVAQGVISGGMQVSRDLGLDVPVIEEKLEEKLKKAASSLGSEKRKTVREALKERAA